MKNFQIHSFLLKNLKIMKVNIQLFLAAVLVFISFNAFAQVAAWDFRVNEEMGDISEIQLKGATLTDKGLVVSQNKWATATYSGKALKEKTLIVMATVGALGGGGSAFTIDHTNKDVFDGVVLGERKAGQWIAGSNGYARTNASNTSNSFVETVGETVMMAITYKEVNGKTKVSIYRNGNLLETYEKGALATYQNDVEFILEYVIH